MSSKRKTNWIIFWGWCDQQPIKSAEAEGVCLRGIFIGLYCDVISGHFRHLNPAKITPGMNLDLYANFQDDRSTGLGANPGQTNRQTDRQ